GAQGECGGDGDGAESGDEHQRDQQQLQTGGEVGGDAGGQAHGGECGGDREQRLVEVLVGEDHEGHGGGGDGGHGQQDHGQGLALEVAVQAAVEDVDRALAADLCVYDEEQHGEGGDLDTAGGASAGAADEHQHVGSQPARGIHLGGVDAVEPGGARHHALEEPDQQLPGG